MNGITVDKKDRIIIPTLSFDATNPFNKERYVALAYYNKEEYQRGYTYLGMNSKIWLYRLLPVPLHVPWFCRGFPGSTFLFFNDLNPFLKRIHRLQLQ